MGEPDRATPAHAVRLADWVDARLEGVERELAMRVRSAIADVASEATVLDAPRSLIAAAVARLAPLATDGCTARESAADLLTVDALVTLACEALADGSMSVDDIADGATVMVRAIAATLPALDGAA